MPFHLRKKIVEYAAGELSAASIPAIRDAWERLVLKTFQSEKHF